MSNFKTHRLNEEELLSQSSDEKMDTGSESFRSQDTPNSVRSSDFDDRSTESNVLRFTHPEDPEPTDVLRLSQQESNDNTKTVAKTKLEKEFNDSIVTKMSNLKINSPKIENRPKNLGLSPPKFSSSLVLTTSHPLMGLGSPDDYPDLIPKQQPKVDDKDLSLSSIEDERPSETNGYEFYSPQMNTSKNNLYFSENFTTADSQMLTDSNLDNSLPPDVARVDQKARRRIVASFLEKPKREFCSTPHTADVRGAGSNTDGSAIEKYIGERKKKLTTQSTPRSSLTEAVDTQESDYHCGQVTEWCESPSQLRSRPDFQLPIELSTTFPAANELESPDVVSSSTQEDKSAYQALLDPYTGSVALRHTAGRSPNFQRRKIQLPPEDDRCSLDSVSGSLDSEEEPPEPESEPAAERGPVAERQDSDDDTKGSKSTNTLSEGSASEPIPEYSLADELREERSWLRVRGLHVCDMQVIEPYKRVLSHGGYDPCGAAIIVFSACHLPDNGRADYRYCMDNLFLYVVWTLERLVTDEYVLVYLHGSAGGGRLPTFRWLQECYKLIDRRLRKSLRHLYLVHPTFWLKSLVILTKPFISSKFFRKLSYVSSLRELLQRVPVEPNAIPELVKQYDERAHR